MGRVPKRPEPESHEADPSSIRGKRAAFLSSLSRGVSPPSSRLPPNVTSKSCSTGKNFESSTDAALSPQTGNTSTLPLAIHRQSTISAEMKPKTSVPVRSPFQLNHIRDLPDEGNIDTVRLHDILGDPLIEEAWIFNFCFDVDWLMGHFDPDTRDMVKIKIVHGSWRREDMNKIMIDDACARMANVQSVQAYLPDSFGTHHSKMFVLIRHDDHAQVIIHTANMLAKDWTNMSQAIWRSPLLPLQPQETNQPIGPIGSGSRFKHDLLRYLKAYGNKLGPLLHKIKSYDFSAIKAALIASVPSKLKTTASEVWGHEALRRAVSAMPQRSSSPYFVFQVSSIASLPTEWLEKSLYRATDASASNTFIVFPTAEDVRISLDGYFSGGSIHTKAQKDAHLKQISLLRPQLCRWNQGRKSTTGRHRAAPHIKTYMRFTSSPFDNTTPEIDWVLVTSANLSTQAWGSAPKMLKGTTDSRDPIVHIQSFEIGVLLWPEMFTNEFGTQNDNAKASVFDSSVSMLPVFREDMPQVDKNADVAVGIRMPYDLPLTRYAAGELPWSPQSTYTRPDAFGRGWGSDTVEDLEFG